jgi:O-antigen/teichoic acid export membrane protein
MGGASAPGQGSFLGKAGPLVLARLCTVALAFCIPLVLARTLTLQDYGTYKQLFLVSQTLLYVLPLGMAQALFFFLPRAEVKRPYLVQTMLFLTGAGLLAALLLFAFGDAVARRFSNPALIEHRREQAIYLVCLLASFPLEISLIGQGRTRQAAAVYLVSDTLRAGAMIGPVLLGFGLTGVMVAVAAFAACRYAAAWVATLRSGPGPLLDRRLFRTQLGYALPFGAAMLVAIPQQYAHQYVVSGAVAPEAFAIYAVGCFQLPVVDLLYTPTSEVLMVRLGELEKQGRLGEGVLAFREAAARLALVFFPAATFLFAAAPELIGALFGERFAAAVPLFRVGVVGVALAVLPVDGVLRARNQTGYLFRAYLLKALVTVPLVWVGVKRFGMLGGIASWALAEAFGKGLLLWRVPRALSTPSSRLTVARCIPWKDLGRASLAAVAAAAGVAGLRAVAGGAAAGWPEGLVWRAIPLAVAGILFLAGYLAVLRITGVRPLSVLQSLRSDRG